MKIDYNKLDEIVSKSMDCGYNTGFSDGFKQGIKHAIQFLEKELTAFEVYEEEKELVLNEELGS